MFGRPYAESKDESSLKLPERISVELRPRTRAAWAHVQALAQNPRVVISLLANRRLSHVIDFLNSKWKSSQPQTDVSLVVVILTSTPVIRTGVYPHVGCRSPPVVASVSHGPRDCSASLSHLANYRPMHYQFFTF